MIAINGDENTRQEMVEEWWRYCRIRVHSRKGKGVIVKNLVQGVETMNIDDIMEVSMDYP